MKKLMTLLLAVCFAFTLTLGSTGCGKKDDGKAPAATDKGGDKGGDPKKGSPN